MFDAWTGDVVTVMKTVTGSGSRGGSWGAADPLRLSLNAVLMIN